MLNVAETAYLGNVVEEQMRETVSRKGYPGTLTLMFSTRGPIVAEAFDPIITDVSNEIMPTDFKKGAGVVWLSVMVIDNRNEEHDHRWKEVLNTCVQQYEPDVIAYTMSGYSRALQYSECTKVEEQNESNSARILLAEWFLPNIPGCLCLETPMTVRGKTSAESGYEAHFTALPWQHRRVSSVLANPYGDPATWSCSDFKPDMPQTMVSLQTALQVVFPGGLSGFKATGGSIYASQFDTIIVQHPQFPPVLRELIDNSWSGTDMRLEWRDRMPIQEKRIRQVDTAVYGILRDAGLLWSVSWRIAGNALLITLCGMSTFPQKVNRALCALKEIDECHVFTCAIPGLVADNREESQRRR